MNESKGHTCSQKEIGSVRVPTEIWGATGMCTCGVAKLLSQLNRFQMSFFPRELWGEFFLLHVERRDKMYEIMEKLMDPQLFIWSACISKAEGLLACV